MWYVDYMAINTACHLITSICRDNLAVTKRLHNSIYLTYKLHANSGGCYLSGFEATKKMIHSPDLSNVKDEDNMCILDQVTHDMLVLLLIKGLLSQGSMTKFNEIMLTSLLEYYYDVFNYCREAFLLVVKLSELFGNFSVPGGWLLGTQTPVCARTDADRSR